ncbi:cytochrome c oxidase assembly protein Coa5 [Schizosaccharomyces osmophilus]|uniref:Cytochrome c oxidase assembly protein Coa5 n=1 Tax=Schizosaccharomyces osmophilus TaxID=2545709 RepID=A0AAE9WEH3_9SCHI|nr:cytochrome c oxidase assembly protein Coa5 [Schizosaccharomyces osmophilus]WBW73761.1 cytochrome c oxidase assembly protein Coa5 [Schizosaccharomyces osmophilus]
MGRSCNSIRKDLADCLLHSDCMFIHGKSARECMRNKEQLPVECRNLMTSFGECKRQMLDMTKRYRIAPEQDESSKPSPEAK